MVSECTHFMYIWYVREFAFYTTTSCLCLHHKEYLCILRKVCPYGRRRYAPYTLTSPIQLVSSWLSKNGSLEKIFFFYYLIRNTLRVTANNVKSYTCVIFWFYAVKCEWIRHNACIHIYFIYICMMNNSMHALVPCPNVDCKGTKWPLIWCFIYANDTNKYVIQSGSNVFDDTSTSTFIHTNIPPFVYLPPNTLRSTFHEYNIL